MCRSPRSPCFPYTTHFRSRARRLARQCGRLGLIVIDYLQLMSGTREGDNRASELSEISRSVKSLAKELNVPIMALSDRKSTRLNSSHVKSSYAYFCL